MKAILLAAGLGTRLKPLTDTTPKPLVPVNGLPLIFYNLALLQKYGIQEVVINLHHLGHQIESTLGSGEKLGFKLSYSHELEILGTGGGIKKAQSLLGEDLPVLVLNGDILTDFSISKLIHFHHTQNALATLVVKEAAADCPFGRLTREPDGRITSILGEPPHQTGLDTFFTGAQILDPPVLAHLLPNQKSCIVRDALIPTLLSGQKISGFLQTGYWNDLGTLERLEKTQNELAQGQISLSYAAQLEKFRRLLK